MANTQFASRARGFSLVDLLSTLTVGTVLVTTAVPSFDGLAAKSRMSTEVNLLVSHLYLARSEAVKRLQPTVLCPSANGSDCLDAPEWHRGYILFADTNNNGARDASEELLRVHHGDSTRLTALSSVSRKRVTYRPTGMSNGANLTVTFCDARNATPPKAVIVANTGRPRVSDTKPDGGTLTCG